MASFGSDIRISRVPLPPLPALETEWRELQARSEHSFFMSWAWIGTWLASLPARVRPTLLRAEVRGRVVGLAVICSRPLVRSRLIRSRALFVNCTGDPELDGLTLEYNGFLADREGESEIGRRLVQWLTDDPDWDEIFLDGWHRLDLVDDLHVQGLRTVTRKLRPYPFVDLTALPKTTNAYLVGLRSRVRYKINRSLRVIAGRGAVTIDAAASTEQALLFLEGLKRMHQHSWQARGFPGAFSDAFFDAFHKSLIQERFDEGVVQLLRISAGKDDVGYCYNFVYRGRVYQYQSGFDYELVADSRWTPGFVSHARAIELNKDAGQLVYDFMAGDQAYKKHLASGSADMLWIVLQRPRVRFRLEDFLRSMKAKLRGARIRSS